MRVERHGKRRVGTGWPVSSTAVIGQRAGICGVVAAVAFVAACRGADSTATAADPADVPPATDSVSTTADLAEVPSPTEPVSATVDLSYVPPGVDPSSECLERAVFRDPAESPYTLPFHVGNRHLVTQSYCISGGGHANQLAYDFNVAIGVDVLAARGGVVLDTKDSSPDDGQGQGDHNYVFIQHEDGTVAFYAHLRHGSVVVEEGERVEAGQRIAASGNSGLTGRPHLHFGVYQGWPPREGHDIPVNFRNARGPLDPRNGLMTDRVYAAESWDEV